MNDPQFGITHILRPYSGFTDDYEGESASIPIQFTELGRALDDNAGKPGYSSKLLRGLTSPMGSRAKIWLPNVQALSGLIVLIPYIWVITFRLRNAFDYRQTRNAYHYPKQGPGQDDTTAPLGQQTRVVIPAATKTLLYVNTQPALNNGSRAVNNLFPEDFSVQFTQTVPPFIPGGARGEYQQGVLNPAIAGTDATQPGFCPIELQADADEIMIGCYRTTHSGDAANWAFGTVDAQFASYFDNNLPDIGVYVQFGTSNAEVLARSDNVT